MGTYKTKSILQCMVLLGLEKLGFNFEKGCKFDEVLRANGVRIAKMSHDLIKEQALLVMGDYPTPQDGERLWDEHCKRYSPGGVKIEEGHRFVKEGTEYEVKAVLDMHGKKKAVCCSKLTERIFTITEIAKCPKANKID